MGSFYSTCSISHMTLRGGERTSIQLLVPNWEKDFKGCLGMIVSNDGCQNFFAPFGFPIHGEYSDYGQIECIIRDKNVEMLEDYFNLSIEQIISNVGDDRWHKLGEIKYKGADSNSWKLKGKDGGEVKNQKTFLGMGMTYFRTEVLEHLQDGWKGIKTKGKVEKYSSDSFIKDIFDSIDKMNAKPTDTGEWDDIIVKVSKQLADGEWNENNEEERQKLKKYLRAAIRLNSNDFFHEFRSYIPSLVKTNMFNVLPINTKDFGDDIKKQYQFITAFGYELSRTLLPSNYGSQETNWEATYKLNEVVNDLLDNNLNDELIHQIEDYIDSETNVFDYEGFKDDHSYMNVDKKRVMKLAKKIQKDLVVKK